MDLVRAWAAAVVSFLVLNWLASMAAFGLMRLTLEGSESLGSGWPLAAAVVVVFFGVTALSGLAYPAGTDRPRRRLWAGVLSVPAIAACAGAALLYATLAWGGTGILIPLLLGFCSLGTGLGALLVHRRHRRPARRPGRAPRRLLGRP